MPLHPDQIIEGLAKAAITDAAPPRELAIGVFDDRIAVEDLLTIAEGPRERHFGRTVRLHILNNVRNGYCPEDCGYCAQRKGAGGIEAYGDKTDEEILNEAEAAARSGAYRYCMVTSGRGPTRASVERYARLIGEIKSRFGLEICLSAGIVTDADLARQLASAGLDRYNHNLNTSEEHYGEICETHGFQDRLTTLDNMRGAGVSLCSGVIAGMGETVGDLVSVAYALKEREVPSIPVNFFLPVPGHAIKKFGAMQPEHCLRVLILFRLVNPTAEVRMAAGREMHLRGEQAQALRVANSLFVSGYLNVRGSNIHETLGMIQRAGYSIDAAHSDLPEDLLPLVSTTHAHESVELKARSDLRPFEKEKSGSS